MKMMFAVLLLTTGLFGSTLDQLLSSNTPGQKLFATPGSSFGVRWEDSFDNDFNDQIILGYIDALGQTATITWYSAEAALNDVLKYQGDTLLSNLSHPNPVTINITPGLEFVLTLKVGGDKDHTGTDRAIVWQDSGASVPEPASVSLIGLGLLAVGLKRRCV